MKKYIKYANSILCLLLVMVMLLTGCKQTKTVTSSIAAEAWGTMTSQNTQNTSSDDSSDEVSEDDTNFNDTEVDDTDSEDISLDEGKTDLNSEDDDAQAEDKNTQSDNNDKETEDKEEVLEEKFTKPDSGALTSKSKAVKGKNNKLTAFRVLTEKPVAYELLEFEMNIPDLPENANVYLESDVDITIEMVSSAGKKIVADAFYFEEYEFTEAMQLKGRTEKVPVFRLRVSPQGGGTWDFTVTLAISGKKVDTLSGYVNVAKNSDGSQLLEVEPNRKQNFQTVSGKVIPLIGENLNGNPENNGIHSLWGKELVEYMKACDEFGGNYGRIWDYLDNGSGMKKSVNIMAQDASAMWDYVFDSAEEMKYYISFVTLNHGEISTEVDGRWDASVWYKPNGGYVDDCVDFFTDKKCIAAYKTYLRYVISRWGYSEYVMCWEIFNEIEHTNAVRHNKFDEVRAWLQEVTDYIREIDPYNHMVANSCGNADHPLANYHIFDFLYYHRYAENIDIENIAGLQKNRWLQYKKPVLLGEAGVEKKWAAILGGFVTEDLVAFHQHNWAGIMGGGAGTGMNWYWNHLDNVDGYWDFQILSEISKLIPFEDKNIFMVNTTSASPSNEQIGAMGYRGKDYAYLWFYDEKFKPLNQTETLFKNETASVKIEDGTYYVRWVNTWTGVSMKKEKLTATDGLLTFEMPEWSKDVAVAITRY